MSAPKTIIFIGGMMATGKSTIANILAAIARQLGLQVALLKFAAPIYALQSIMYEMAGKTPIKNRGLMFAIGDAARQQIGSDYFVNVMETAIAKSTADIIIADDMRLLVELEFARKIGAVTVQIGAPREMRKKRAESLGTWSENGHATEQVLPFDQFDHTVNNIGDMGDLNYKALKLWTCIFPMRIEPVAPSQTPKPPAVRDHIHIVDTLLQKHYGITIDDTDLEDDAEVNVEANVRPFQVVNWWAEDHNLSRIDGKTYQSSLPLTDREEEEAITADSEPLEENFDGEMELFHAAQQAWHEHRPHVCS